MEDESQSQLPEFFSSKFVGSGKVTFSRSTVKVDVKVVVKVGCLSRANVTWALHTLSNVRLILDSNGRWRQIPEHPRYVRRRLVGDVRRVGVTVSHNWTTSQRK